MAQALPLTKLAGLLVKTLAKPLSKRIKNDFSRYNVTKQFLVQIGQTSHYVTSAMTIWSAGYRVRSISPLDPEKALTKGADFFGETLIFCVSGGVMIWEYNRSKESTKQKELEKAAKVKAEQEALKAKLKALDVRLHAVEDVVKANAKSILNLTGVKYNEPTDQINVPIVVDENNNNNENDENIHTLSINYNNNKQQSSSSSSSSTKSMDEKESYNAKNANNNKQRPWWKFW